MTDKLTQELINNGSQNLEQQVSNDAATVPDPAISALQSELNNVKEVLKTLEAQSQQARQVRPVNQPSDVVKQAVANDLKTIAQMIAKGKLTPQQGAILKDKLLQKAFGSNTLPPRSNQPQMQAQAQEQVSVDPFGEFEKTNPQFFSSDARNSVKSYMQQQFDSISPDELNKVVDLIKIIEEAAVSSFQQTKENESVLEKTNSEAKKRLLSSALNASKSVSGSKTFTREEIGKMSPDEFRENEPAIMEQLRKGQIK